MSTNNQMIVCYIKKEKVWAVFENCCVDNDFKKPISSKNCEFKSKDKNEAFRWATRYAINNMVEYGVSII